MTDISASDARPDPGLAPARDSFDLPAGVTYLNTAFMGPLPRVAMQAGCDGLARKVQPWGITADDFVEPVDGLRGSFASLLGVPGDLDGIAINTSVSYGVSTAAANLHLLAGEKVVILDQQFPSDVYAWEKLAVRHGGSVHTVARPDDGDWTAAIIEDLRRLGDQVAVVSVPPCHWIDGARIDLEAVGTVVRDLGAALAVDTCQWLGAAPFDVKAVRPDFVFGATYKWLCGPYSVGFLWAAPHRRHGEPIEQGWISRANSSCLACLADYTPEYQAGARRFDVGEVANFALVPAARAAVDLVASWGAEAAAIHSSRLTTMIAAGAEALGLVVPPERLRSPHIIGLRFADGGDAEVVAPSLEQAGVYVSARGDAIRVSAHAYNNEEDVDRFLAVLERTVG